VSIRIQQTLTSLRSRGVARTLTRIWRTVAREKTWTVPVSERVWLSRNGFKPISYVIYDFGNKSVSERKEYLSDAGLLELGVVNGQRGWFLKNKLVFHRMIDLSPKRLSAPHLVALVHRGEIIQAAPPNSSISVEDLKCLGRDFFLKPLTSAKGDRVRRARLADIEPIIAGLNSKDDYLVVQTIEQAEYSRQIFPNSFNTVRAMAMRAPRSREIFVPCAVHRFGSIDTIPLDSWSRGGLSCNIDVESGSIGVGIRHPSCTRGRLVKYDKHPDTGAQLDGVSIPNWREALQLLTELMELFPDIEFVGWDLLATDGGWRVIEGNPQMHINLLQAHRGLLSDDRVRQFISYHCPGIKSSLG
jgi:hypothetical protein